MQSTHYSAKDVMALHLLRMIPQDRRNEKPMDEAHFEERVQSYFNNHPVFSSIAPQDRLTYAEFKEVYAPRIGKEDFLNTVTANDYAPYVTDDAAYFQRLHGEVAQVRERMVNTVVANALNEPDVSTVLIIYGGAHRVMSGPMWEAALGKGVDIDPRVEAAAQAISHLKQPAQPARHELGNTAPRSIGNDIGGDSALQP